jgi:hypothetical protein
MSTPEQKLTEHIRELAAQAMKDRPRSPEEAFADGYYSAWLQTSLSPQAMLDRVKTHSDLFTDESGS